MAYDGGEHFYGLASSAREGRGGHMTMMTTGAVGEARQAELAACRAFLFQRDRSAE